MILRTEWDELSMMLSNMTMVGTKRTRGNVILENNDHIQRNLYVCKKPLDGANHNVSQETDFEGPSDCFSCGKDFTPVAVPEGLELGPYVGRLPPLPTAWDRREYLGTVPDGVYRLLWMNNNQLPMF